MGCHLVAQIDHTQVLDDKGIHAGFRAGTDHLHQLRDLLVRDQCVEGQMDSDTSDVAVFHRLHQCLRGEILCALPGIKCAATKIYGICAILNRCAQRFHRPRGGQKFQHSNSSPLWYT